MSQHQGSLLAPRSLGLPFQTWRQGQREAVVQSLMILDGSDGGSTDSDSSGESGPNGVPDAPPSGTQRGRGGPQAVLLDAPTGSGKSGIAVAVAELLRQDYDQVVILTGTKQLQRQYLHEFPQLAEVRGRQNFPCAIEPGVQADLGICTTGQPCPHKGPLGEEGCAYYDQKRQAIQASILVTNYAYFLAEWNYVQDFSRPALVVCDEAHTVEEHLRQFITVTLRRSTFQQLDLPPLPDLGLADATPWSQWARQLLRSPAWGTVRSLTRTLGRESYAQRQLVRRIRALGQALSLLGREGNDGWVIEKTLGGYRFRPLWTTQFSERFLLRHAPKWLFLSATILDKALFCQSLGLNPQRTTYLTLPSSFPADRRPLWYRPVGRVIKKNRGAAAKVVQAVDRLLVQHQGQKGLIHTVSYALSKAILSQSAYRDRLLTHRTKNREEVLQQFRQSKDKVLVSPSMTTGVDLPYDECRFQIICKLPWPDLGDPQVKKRMKIGPDGEVNKTGQRWYNWCTAARLIQTYGRGMRASDDYCDTYLLDESWERFEKWNRKMLPPWFREALR